jgi:hypothetical protein
MIGIAARAHESDDPVWTDVRSVAEMLKATGT